MIIFEFDNKTIYINNLNAINKIIKIHFIYNTNTNTTCYMFI